MPASRYVLFFALALTGLAVDLITKEIVFRYYFDPSTYLQPGHVPVQHWWIDGVLGIETSTNPGALFGLGQGFSGWFAALSIVALLAILFWLFVARAATDRLLTFTMGLIAGGIMGNLFDRIGLGYRAGYAEEIRYNVRDWIHFRLDGVPLFDPWPNFNVADSLLVCGAVLLFVHAMFLSRRHPTAEASDR